LWVFDVGTHTWCWISGHNNTDGSSQTPVYGTKGIPSKSNYPGGRQDGEAFFSKGKFYFFGGHGYESPSNAGLLNDIVNLSY
jgi:hypothetical protein